VIVTLSGVSASGKTTIEKGLRLHFNNLKPVISYTTRPPSKSDLSGNYVHLSREEFKRMKDVGEFIWDVYIFGNQYGTTHKSLRDTLAEPDSIFFMVIEPESVRKLRLFARESGIKVVSFYILSPAPEVLRKRLSDRGREDAKQIENRIIEAVQWDKKALCSDIPFLFVGNSQHDPEARAAVSEVSAGIVRHMAAQ